MPKIMMSKVSVLVQSLLGKSSVIEFKVYFKSLDLNNALGLTEDSL